MLVQNLIDLINLEAEDLLDDDGDTIKYINAAIRHLSLILATLNDFECMVVVDIAPGLPIPENFYEFVPPNGYPVVKLGNMFNTLTGGTVKGVKYTTFRPSVSLVSDQVPFRDIYTNALVFISCYLIKKKSYIPPTYVSQDKAFVDEIMSLIGKSKGG